jgi:hypothetical protein
VVAAPAKGGSSVGVVDYILGFLATAAAVTAAVWVINLIKLFDR